MNDNNDDKSKKYNKRMSDQAKKGRARVKRVKRKCTGDRYGQVDLSYLETTVKSTIKFDPSLMAALGMNMALAQKGKKRNNEH